MHDLQDSVPDGADFLAVAVRDDMDRLLVMRHDCPNRARDGHGSVRVGEGISHLEVVSGKFGRLKGVHRRICHYWPPLVLALHTPVRVARVVDYTRSVSLRQWRMKRATEVAGRNRESGSTSVALFGGANLQITEKNMSRS